MSELEYTPGPWVVRKRNPPSHGYLFGFHIGNSEQRNTVCEVVNEHDAKLIAAAPEMLAALELALQDMARWGILGPGRNAVESAIRKTKGE